MEDIIRLRHIGDTLVLDLVGDGIDSAEFDINLQYIQKMKNMQKLYVNIANLYKIDNDTLGKLKKMRNLLKDKYVCLINVSAINNSILNLFGIDKMFQLYMSKDDAVAGKYPLVNRKFRIVS